jgi:site-specific DNA recombinase
METIKCAGYVRVSGKGQIDNESLTTQRKSITDFAKKNEYSLTKIYADEGISGGSVKDRHALLQCLIDGQNSIFKILVVHRLSRFGRNALELLNNYQELKKAGIELVSISEGMDFSTSYGEAMLGLLSVIAQLEREIIRDQMLENRIARGRRGIPTVGSLPYARTFIKETGEWKLDEDKAEIIRKVAEEFLDGESLSDIAKRLSMSYFTLRKRLIENSGDKWVVKFKDQEPMIYKIPFILTDDIIEKVKDRLAFNRTSNRTDIYEKYLLSGFIRCDNCKSMISGQTLRGKKNYRYYKHRHSSCKAFYRINAPAIEKAIFETIFENIVDEPNFEKAIASSLPDINMIDNLKAKIKDGEKRLKKVQTELDKLVAIALNGTLTDETIKGKETELLKEKTSLNHEIEETTQQLDSLPNINDVKEEADQIRRMLLEQYGGKRRLREMTFDDKRTLLHWLFDGKDDEGTPYGIYVNTKGNGRGKDQIVDYFIYGKIQGLRTLKGDDINYMGLVDEEIKRESENPSNYKTFLSASRQRK